MITETITNVAIFLISESKVDPTFLNMQFKLDGYKLFSRDRNRFGGRLVLYLNEEILLNFLNHHPIVAQSYSIAMMQSMTKH